MVQGRKGRSEEHEAKQLVTIDFVSGDLVTLVYVLTKSVIHAERRTVDGGQ
jgi:hypothetical protein